MRSVGPVSFWWRWVAANAVGELIGLGGVAGAGYLFIALFGEPESIIHGIGTALFFVLAGSFEGYVLGLAQGKVLRLRIPTLEGWVKATVVGAVVAWALGMTPSMIMSFVQPATPEAPPDMSTGLRMALAAGLGMAAGPLLAFFQWRVLRNYRRGPSACRSCLPVCMGLTPCQAKPLPFWPPQRPSLLRAPSWAPSTAQCSCGFAGPQSTAKQRADLGPP